MRTKRTRLVYKIRARAICGPKIINFRTRERHLFLRNIRSYENFEHSKVQLFTHRRSTIIIRSTINIMRASSDQLLINNSDPHVTPNFIASGKFHCHSMNQNQNHCDSLMTFHRVAVQH